MFQNKQRENTAEQFKEKCSERIYCLVARDDIESSTDTSWLSCCQHIWPQESVTIDLQLTVKEKKQQLMKRAVFSKFY